MKKTNKLLISIVSAISFSAYSNDINDAKVCFMSWKIFLVNHFVPMRANHSPLSIMILTKN